MEKPAEEKPSRSTEQVEEHRLLFLQAITLLAMVLIAPVIMFIVFREDTNIPCVIGLSAIFLAWSAFKWRKYRNAMKAREQDSQSSLE